LDNEDRYNLNHHLKDDEQQNEDAEHLVLQTLYGVVALEEREAEKETAANAKQRLGKYVRWHPPILL